jgi:predicted dehydrogenase
MKSDGGLAEPKQGRVRFGLVGCGRIGVSADEDVRQWAIAPFWLPLSHASAIRGTDQAELAAVCDVNEAAARHASKQYQVSAWYADYRQMLACERLDALAIATRTNGRREIIEQGVASGIKAIYCEKPLTNTLEDADVLAALLEQKNIFFVYGARRRYMPAYRAARELIEAGEIGELTTIVVRLGNSLLFWGHPHSVDIASFFAGDADVEYVQADLDLDPACVRGSVIDSDPRVRMAYIKFVTGVKAYIVPSDSFDVELAGTKGILGVRSDGSAVRCRSRLSEGRDDGWFLAERAIPVNGAKTGTINSVKALVDAVLEGKDPGYNIRLAVRNQEMLFGFVYSHLQDGGKIHFPIERRQMRITGRYGERFA